MVWSASGYVGIICPPACDDGIAERYNLFNDVMNEVFWEYDNQGLKLLQLRVYEVEGHIS